MEKNRFRKVVPKDQNLEDMYLNIGDIVRPFVTLNVEDAEGHTVISNTIPNCMIFVDPHRNELIQFMSSNGIQSTWVAKTQLSRYKYSRGQSFIHYVFTCTIG